MTKAEILEDQAHTIHNQSFICAVGPLGCIVLATDSEAIEADIDQFGPALDDLGLSPPSRDGIYKWTGNVKMMPEMGEYGAVLGWEAVYFGDFELVYEYEALSTPPRPHEQGD